MKQSSAQKAYVVLGLAILAAVIYLLYIMLAKFFNWFSTLENQVAVSIVTASGVALISTVGLILSKHYEHKREINKAHNS